MASQCLFDFTTKDISSTNINLKYLLLKAIGKKLGKKNTLFNCFDRF